MPKADADTDMESENSDSDEDDEDEEEVGSKTPVLQALFLFLLPSLQLCWCYNFLYLILVNLSCNYSFGRSLMKEVWIGYVPWHRTPIYVHLGVTQVMCRSDLCLYIFLVILFLLRGISLPHISTSLYWQISMTTVLIGFVAWIIWIQEANKSNSVSFCIFSIQ